MTFNIIMYLAMLLAVYAIIPARKKGIIDKVQKESSQIKMIQLFGEDYDT